MSSANNPGVVVPPPLIFVAFLGAGLAIDHILGWSLGLANGLRYTLASCLVMIAVSFLIAALGLFRRFGTRPEPWQPTTAIVSTGVYRFTRNPMYLGMALAYTSLSIAADGPAALALLPVVLLVIRYYAIEREERYLEAKFGSQYTDYKARVRRWI